MLDTLKRYRKITKKDRHLRQLVQAYSSPWVKRRGTFRDYERKACRRNLSDTTARFEADCRGIAQQFVTSGMTIEHPLMRTVLGVLLFKNANASLDMLQKAIHVMVPDAPKSEVAISPSMTSAEAAMIVLDHMAPLEETLFQYDYGFLEDIVPIIRSRYIAEDGRYQSDITERFLQVLWFLANDSLPSPDSVSWVQELSQCLQGFLSAAEQTRYQPVRHQCEEYLNDLLPKAMADEFRALKCEDDPARYKAICAALFKEVNARATDHYEERDISLVYGYENNHHVILRTLLGLIADGRLTRDDRVLVLGPRYVDEIRFFREILNLKNTVGLDLRSEGDYLVEGDMHQMPFPDNTFKLVFGANVVEYAYNYRQVVREIARVTQRPGYVSIIHRSNRAQCPTPIGRMDIGNVTIATNAFYEHAHQVLVKDSGLTEQPDKIGTFPSFVLELTP